MNNKIATIHKVQTSPEISIVVLGYKAGYGLKPLIEKLQQSIASVKRSYEIILVANYWERNEDSTPKVAKELGEKISTVRPICKVKKEGEGMGWDMREGLKLARGKYIAVLDGDAQNPVEDVARACTLLIDHPEIELVKARRVKRYDGLTRILVSRVYNLLFKLLFQSNPLDDINGKPKAFTKEIYQRLNLTANDWFIDAEIMLESMQLNLKISEFETKFYKNPYRSTFVKISTVFEFLDNLIQYRLKRWKK